MVMLNRTLNSVIGKH